MALRVVIAGGGCSGALVAINLLSRVTGACDVIIVEPGPTIGAGVAYSTDSCRHLLNQPAGSMSAFSGRPNELVRWAQGQGLDVSSHDFLERRLYAKYLRDALARACRNAAPQVRFEHIESQVSDVTTNTRDRQSAFVVGLTDGRQLAADEFVLAIGSVPAAPPKVLANLPSEFLVADPWRPGGLEGIPKDGDVLLIGSGLTMVDVALALDDPAAPTRRIVARSRRGLLPLDHRPGPIAIWPGFEMPSSKTAAGIMHAFRGAAEKAFADGWDWRAVVAATRPHLTEIWQGLPTIEQRRLLKHAMRYWEIHRHPMAPKVAAQVDQLRATGRLSVGPGTVTRAEVVGPRVRAVLETSQRPESVEVVKVVYCAGPDCDVVTSHPLAQQMRGAGLVRRHANGVGLAVDADGHLLGAGGLNSSLHAVGFVRRGEELESSAVREIRLQAERLADRLAWAIDGTEHIGAWEAEVRADRSIAPSRLRK